MAANVQSMCQYWKNINLQELQRDLDVTATDLANRQDESDGSRKRLVEQSRDFKKNTPEDIRKVVAPLLKSFQLEVDSLSKRSKAAEAAFLSIYKKLIDLPDPVPALEHAQTAQKKAQRVQDLEIENKQLRETLDEYNHEFAEVKNQEVTIKQLKEKLKEHEERLEVTAQTRAKEKERELQRQFAEKERQIQDSQLAVAKKLGEAEHSIASLRSSLESVQSELFEVKSKYDEATSAKSDEMDMVMADLERANERAANAERQTERLKQELALATENLANQSSNDTDRQGQRSSASDQAMDILKRSTLEVELAAKEKEIAQLVEDVQRLQASLNKLRESTSAQVSKLEEELSSKNLAFRTLEDRLKTQEDYEEIKRELRVLKSIEFAGAYQEGSRPEENKSLEMLLLEKNKALQSENTHLKVVNSGLTDLDINTSTTSSTTSSSPSTIIPPFTSRSFSGMSSSASPAGSCHPARESAAGGIFSSSGSLSSPSSTVTSSLVHHPSGLPPSPSSLSMPTAVSISSSSSAAYTTASSSLSMPSSHRFSSPSSQTEGTAAGLLPGFLPMAIKKESPSPASVSSNPTHPISATTTTMSMPLPHQDSQSQRASVGTPSSGRQSPSGSMANCKLSPEIPTPSQTPQANVPPIPSPITALHPHLDPRHFTPPIPPFYPFQSSPFHTAFMPLNMVKSEVSSPSGGLDTGYVAKNVRELLSIHNIGQRLFAKHVLGLSQGTVSELLSKPKSWDKLTEKGRESYRKMHAWANDDANIMALKAISPKKGTQPLAPNNSYKEKEDAVTEERIALILNEAQMQMHMKKSLEQQQVANAVESSIYQSGLSKLGGIPPGINIMSPTLPPNSIANGPHFPRENSRKSRDADSRHHSSSSSQEETSSAQELVTRIYRQELEKLKKAADAAGNIAASAMYAQELSRLNTPVPGTNGSFGGGLGSTVSSSSSSSSRQRVQSPPQSDPHQQSLLALDYRANRPNGLKVKTEPPDSTSDSTASQTNNYGAIDLSKPSSQTGSTPGSSPTSDSGRHSGSAFFLVRPRVNGHDAGTPENPHTPTTQQQQQQPQGSAGGPRYGSVPPAECLSPLQRMQNIANSLTSRPQLGMPNSKPLRAVLPPITQEEFDRYANMNTDDLVKKVKETLSQYSISQRLFGESVLGLSQGSVSDLLARPKPWHMLTQKGREPFIRMQIFLEDADSIPRLVASQYRIPPDKLMRSNSRGSNEAAHRRRKSSMDDRCFDSPTQPKRPRVFFTEDQKDSLRQAYAQDPYPNQSTIENLAKSLNVGVKTVINWFHNHRMRAKQQHHSGGVGGNGGGQDALVKSEPDESSNQSDISSMSGEANPGAMMGGQFFHASGNPTDLNQWMFPQFEAMPLMQKLSAVDDSGEDNKENNGGLEDDEDEMDEPDGLDANASNNNNNSSSANNNNNNNSNSNATNGSVTKDCPGNEPNCDGSSRVNSNSDMNEDNGHDGLSSSSPGEVANSSEGKPSGSINVLSSSSSTSSSQIYSAGSNCSSSSISSVNKRKRSNPQRVYEGAQLDRTAVGKMPQGPTSGNGDLTNSTIIEEEEEEEKDSDHPASPHLAASSGANNYSTKGELIVNGTCSMSRDPIVSREAAGAAPTTWEAAEDLSRPDNLVGGRTDESKSDQRSRKIEKIQKAIKSPVEMWDEEEEGCKGSASSIEKLQKHIETNSTDEEEWEF